MEWVKTTAKTLPEAIDLALDNLGVDESEAEIVVLEEPRQGLFGRMRGTARVEARVKPKAIRPKIERNRNRRSRAEGGTKGKSGDRNRNRGRDRAGKSGGTRDSGGGRDGGARDSGGRDANKRDSGSGRDDRQTDDQPRRESESGRGEQPGRSKSSGDSSRGRSSGRGGSGGDGGARGDRQGGRARSKGNDNDYETKPKEETPVEEVAAHLHAFLSGLTEAFGFDSEVTVDSSEEDVLVGRIEGQHGLLVGPKGRTLDAVQELARISCQRSVPSSVRIKVDVGGYRQRRVEALAEFARKAADSAVEGSVEVALEPMTPADRKAVHDALSEDDRVETRSVGTEPRRKVLVVPVLDDADDHDEAEMDDTDTGDDRTAEGAADSSVSDEDVEDVEAVDVDEDADDGDLVDAGGTEVED